MNDEGWWFQAVQGFCWQMDNQTDICNCRVAFAFENHKSKQKQINFSNLLKGLMIWKKGFNEKFIFYSLT